MHRKTNTKGNSKTIKTIKTIQRPLKHKKKLFSNSFSNEAISSKRYLSQESNADIDGFSSSDGENVDVIYLLENSHKKDGGTSLNHKVEEWRCSDADKCEEIAWSNSSSDNDEISAQEEEEEEAEVDEFKDITFSSNNSKRKLNVSIKEYGSDEEVPVKVKPTLKNDENTEESSQQTIEELSPSPVLFTRKYTTPLLLTEKTEIFKKEVADFIDEEYACVEVASVKKKKVAKGGLAERLQKIVAREKSNLAFWKHDTNAKQDKQSTFVFKVTTISTCFSTTSLYCELFERTPLYIMLPMNVVDKLKIAQGSILRIYPPWKRIFCNDVNLIIVLCAYHMEVLAPCFSLTQTSAAQELIKFHQKHMKKLIGDDRFDTTDNLNLSKLETTYVNGSQTEEKYYTITEAVEQNGFTKYMSFCGVIQRVLCTMVNRITQDKTSFSQKIILSQEKNEKEERYGLVMQDNEGTVCEITIPCSLVMKKPIWKTVISQGEGKFCVVKDFRLVRRRTHNKCSSLRSMVESLNNSSQANNEGNTGVDSIEEPSTQSLGHTVSSSSYLFTVDENTSTIEFRDIPDEYNIPYVPCVKPASPINTLLNGRYLVYFKLLVLTNNTEDSSLSAILSHPCNMYGSCSSKDCYCVHNVKKLSSCVVPSVIGQKIDEKCDSIFLCFKDLYVYNGQFLADAYTRIFLLAEEPCPDDMYLMKCDYLLLKEIPQPLVPFLNASTKNGRLAIVQGVICGVDEETALFWNVCSDCKCDEIVENEEHEVWCDTCGKQTSTQLKMQLDVFLFLSSMPSVCILCKLLEATISSLLPEPCEGNFEGYDMKSVLNKKFGPLLCQVVDVVRQTKQNKEQKIFLKEVNILDKYRME